MKTISTLSRGLCCLLLIGGTVSADIAINIDPGRNNPNAPDTTLNDFITQNPDSGLTASSTFLNSEGNDGGSLFGQNFTSPGTNVGAFVVTAGRNNGVVGSGIETNPETDEPLNASDSGFNAGVEGHNDLAPITEGYVFNAIGHFVSIDGLLANSNAGDTIVLSIWGIGDNVGQNSEFTVTYGGNTASEGNVQGAIYNSTGELRDSAVGSVPFVNFTFVADGATDQIRFDIGGTGVLNAFSLAVVPGGATPIGDFNVDGVVDCLDIDEYIGNLGQAATGALAGLDLVADGTIDSADVAFLIETLVVTSNGQTGTFLGDLNCDGQVNVLGDAFILVASLGDNNATSYSQGDINLDGVVNVLGDAFALVANLGMSNTDP